MLIQSGAPSCRAAMCPQASGTAAQLAWATACIGGRKTAYGLPTCRRTLAKRTCGRVYSSATLCWRLEPRLHNTVHQLLPAISLRAHMSAVVHKPGRRSCHRNCSVHSVPYPASTSLTTEKLAKPAALHSSISCTSAIGGTAALLSRDLPVSAPHEQDLFSAFGPVSRKYVAYDRETGQHRGFAFVNFLYRRCLLPRDPLFT